MRYGPDSRLAAGRVAAALSVGLVLVATSCRVGESPDDASMSTQWGPLAVAEFAGGDQALTAGTVEITDRCVFLAEGRGSVLLVWPVERTTWDDEEGAVVFTTLAGERVALHDGDSVTLAGGGSSLAEDGITAEEFVDSITWVSEPDRDCVTDVRWLVDDRAADGDI